jgi:hypothetical protein
VIIEPGIECGVNAFRSVISLKSCCEDRVRAGRAFGWKLTSKATRNNIDVPSCFCRNRGMMRTRIAVVIVALSVIATGACFAANPHMGTWKLNEAKSELAPGTGKNNTVVYTEEKDKMKVTVDGVDKDGKPVHGVWVGQADGKTYKMKGNLAWDASAYKVVNDHTYEITTMKDGKMRANSKSTVTTSGTDADGKKFTSKAVYDKQ